VRRIVALPWGSQLRLSKSGQRFLADLDAFRRLSLERFVWVLTVLNEPFQLILPGVGLIDEDLRAIRSKSSRYVLRSEDYSLAGSR
jgi:hypothetical protein